MASLLEWYKIKFNYQPPRGRIAEAIRMMGGTKKFFFFAQTGEEDANEGRNLWGVPIRSLPDDALQPADDPYVGRRPIFK